MSRSPELVFDGPTFTDNSVALSLKQKKCEVLLNRVQQICCWFWSDLPNMLEKLLVVRLKTKAAG